VHIDPLDAYCQSCERLRALQLIKYAFINIAEADLLVLTRIHGLGGGA